MADQLPNQRAEFRVALIGNPGVGKTSMLNTLIKKEAQKLDSVESTIGVTFMPYSFTAKDGTPIKMHICDSFGYNRYRRLNSAVEVFQRAKHILILCYDVTNKGSYDEIFTYVEHARKFYSIPWIVLVGCKDDMEQKRQVLTETAQSFAALHDLLFAECSALKYEGINETFTGAAERLLHSSDFDRNRYRPSNYVDLHALSSHQGEPSNCSC